MKYFGPLVLGSCCAALSLGAAPHIDLSKLPPAAQQENVSYEKDIHPILRGSCLRCHGPERPKARLRLDSREGVLKGSKDGKVVTPGNSEKSLLVIAVSQLDPETAMPPKPRRRGPRGGPGGAGGPEGRGGPGGPGARAGGPGGPGDPATATNHPGGLWPAGPGGPGGGPGRNMGPPPKPLTPAQVGLVRAWIDQGAK